MAMARFRLAADAACLLVFGGECDRSLRTAGEAREAGSCSAASTDFLAEGVDARGGLGLLRAVGDCDLLLCRDEPATRLLLALPRLSIALSLSRSAP